MLDTLYFRYFSLTAQYYEYAREGIIPPARLIEELDELREQVQGRAEDGILCGSKRNNQ
jgi:hypothetical protein